MKRVLLVATMAVAIMALLMSWPVSNQAQIPPTSQLVAESALLNGLAAGALFPFIDSTPNRIARAHVAITDATANCSGGAAPPANIQVLAGVAGGSLVNVTTAASNTGIGSTTQCVFHVTIEPGSNSVPGVVTDIVVVNTGDSALTGINTVTVSATVR